jgi:hypothetical protein
MSVGATGERLVRDRKVLREAERAAEEEQPRSDRQLRVPTSVLLTLLVAVLSVLVGPAFARQWEDRQNARDLKAVIADEIAAATARTVGAGVDVARAERAQVRRHRVVNARAFWVPASLRIETKLRAYFPASMATEWERLVSDVDDFLVNVCANAAPPGQALASNLTDDDRRANIAGWFEYMSRRQPLPRSLRLFTFSEVARTATGDNAEARARIIEDGGAWMFARTDEMTAVLFGAHPAGFSTSRSDLLRDLLP